MAGRDEAAAVTPDVTKASTAAYSEEEDLMLMLVFCRAEVDQCWGLTALTLVSEG